MVKRKRLWLNRRVPQFYYLRGFNHKRMLRGKYLYTNEHLYNYNKIIYRQKQMLADNRNAVYSYKNSIFYKKYCLWNNIGEKVWP